MLNLFLVLNFLLLVIITVAVGGVAFFILKNAMPEREKKSSVKALRKEINKILDRLEKAAKDMETESLTALSKQLEILLEEHEKGGSEND